MVAANINKILKLVSFRAVKHLKNEGGPDSTVSNNLFSTEVLNELAIKAISNIAYC